MKFVSYSLGQEWDFSIAIPLKFATYKHIFYSQEFSYVCRDDLAKFLCVHFQRTSGPCALERMDMGTRGQPFIASSRSSCVREETSPGVMEKVANPYMGKRMHLSANFRERAKLEGNVVFS